MADFKLESIKNLMAMSTLSSTAKNSLLKLIMTDQIDIIFGAIITEKDGLFCLKYPSNSCNFHIINDSIQYHGESMLDDADGTMSDYFENGVLIKQTIYSKSNETVTTNYYDTSKNVTKSTTMSFARFPDPGKNVEEISTKHFQDWLLDRITYRIAVTAAHEIMLHHYGSDLTDYQKHLPWLETFAKCKKYKLTKKDNYHILSW